MIKNSSLLVVAPFFVGSFVKSVSGAFVETAQILEVVCSSDVILTSSH